MLSLFLVGSLSLECDQLTQADNYVSYEFASTDSEVTCFMSKNPGDTLVIARLPEGVELEIHEVDPSIAPNVTETELVWSTNKGELARGFTTSPNKYLAVSMTGNPNNGRNVEIWAQPSLPQCQNLSFTNVQGMVSIDAEPNVVYCRQFFPRKETNLTVNFDLKKFAAVIYSRETALATFTNGETFDLKIEIPYTVMFAATGGTNTISLGVESDSFIDSKIDAFFDADPQTRATVKAFDVIEEGKDTTVVRVCCAVIFPGVIIIVLFGLYYMSLSCGWESISKFYENLFKGEYCKCKSEDKGNNSQQDTVNILTDQDSESEDEDDTVSDFSTA